jgi:hypothetical protein
MVSGGLRAFRRRLRDGGWNEILLVVYWWWLPSPWTTRGSLWTGREEGDITYVVYSVDAHVGRRGLG